MRDEPDIPQLAVGEPGWEPGQNPKLVTLWEQSQLGQEYGAKPHLGGSDRGSWPGSASESHALSGPWAPIGCTADGTHEVMTCTGLGLHVAPGVVGAHTALGCVCSGLELQGRGVEPLLLLQRRVGVPCAPEGVAQGLAHCDGLGVPGAPIWSRRPSGAGWASGERRLGEDGWRRLPSTWGGGTCRPLCCASWGRRPSPLALVFWGCQGAVSRCQAGPEIAVTFCTQLGSARGREAYVRPAESAQGGGAGYFGHGLPRPGQSSFPSFLKAPLTRVH